jgi:hypothetical protein
MEIYGTLILASRTITPFLRTTSEENAHRFSAFRNSESGSPFLNWEKAQEFAHDDHRASTSLDQKNSKKLPKN